MTTIPELEVELEKALADFGAGYGRYASLENGEGRLYGKHINIDLPTGFGKPAPKTVASLRAIVERYFGKVERSILPTTTTRFGSHTAPPRYIVVFVLEAE